MARATFTPFPSLPPELRVMIWRLLLPEKDASALFFYKKGCWLATDDDDDNDDDEDDSVSLSFNHYLLDHVPVRIPLAFVNFEARAIALVCFREQGIQIVFCQERQCHIFVRAFDPTRDAIFISQATWYDFYDESSEVMYEDITSDVQHIALPATILDSGNHDIHLYQLFESHMNIRNISFIVGTPPSLERDAERENSGMSMAMPRRWELRRGREQAFVWHEKCNDFHRNPELGLGENVCTRL